MASFAGINIDAFSDFVTGDWLIRRFHVHRGYATFKALLAACAWNICYARCQCVFKPIQLDFFRIFQMGIKHVHEQLQDQEFINREIVTLYPTPSLAVYCDASWVDGSSLCGLGFVVTNNSNQILFAGSIACTIKSSLYGEAKAMLFALKQCMECNIRLDIIFINCAQPLAMYSS